MAMKRIVLISRRPEVKLWKRALFKAIFVIIALLVCGLLSAIVKPGSFVNFYKYTFSGTFASSKTFMKLLWESSILFIIAVALTPAFKMKFWNIGAEGQVLMGAYLTKTSASSPTIGSSGSSVFTGA